MIINTAKYFNKLGTNDAVSISITTADNEFMSVPLDPANSEYAEIMRQVEAGELTIEPADTEED